jgi:Zn-dependent peptidase ImmA (M78 family)
MTLRVPRLPLAEGAADRVLRELGLAKLPIDPKEIAAMREIRVEAAPATSKGFSGMLAQWDTNFGIMYATHIDNTGFQRFSIAHELGHYFIPGHMEQVLANGAHKSQAGFGSRDPYEQEADFFASALLMPSALIRPIIARQDDGLDLVKAIAQGCVTSLTASAVRYARVSRSAVAVVMSEGGVVDFCLFSEAMKEARVRWPRAGSPLPEGSLTRRFGADQTNIAKAREDSGQADLIDWFDCPRSHIVSEDVIGLGTYGKTLTVLYSSRLTAEAEGLDEEDEDEKLEESWTPRFRR